MNQVSTARKLGVILRVGAQVAKQQAGRSRTLGAISKAVRATAGSFGQVAHQLWLEVTGAIFIFMAGVGGIEIAREWTKYQAGHTTFRPRGSRNLFHPRLRLVWREFVLEGQAKGKTGAAI